MNQKADVVLGDYSGMTQDEVNASQQVASGQITVQLGAGVFQRLRRRLCLQAVSRGGPYRPRGPERDTDRQPGIQYVTVPDLTNYLQADGEQQLKDLGVSVLVTQAVDESVAAGSILRTDPAAGSQVAAGTTVVVYVSRPQVSTTTKVPSLVGHECGRCPHPAGAEQTGLGSQSEEYSDQPVGTIISQNPGAGASIKLNSRVSVVVSAGPEPAPEPEAPSSSDGGSDGSWWGGLWGSSDSSSSSTEGGESASSSGGATLGDWWQSWLS